jgi:hypothetical protein
MITIIEENNCPTITKNVMELLIFNRITGVVENTSSSCNTCDMLRQFGVYVTRVHDLICNQ